MADEGPCRHPASTGQLVEEVGDKGLATHLLVASRWVEDGRQVVVVQCTEEVDVVGGELHGEETVELMVDA